MKDRIYLFFERNGIASCSDPFNLDLFSLECSLINVISRNYKKLSSFDPIQDGLLFLSPILFIIWSCCWQYLRVICSVCHNSLHKIFNTCVAVHATLKSGFWVFLQKNEMLYDEATYQTNKFQFYFDKP